MMSKVIIPWLPLIAALVAGIFALFQIKSNNITNARIKWLDSFKQTLTDFLAECSILEFKQGLIVGINENENEDNFSKHASEYKKKLLESLTEHLKVIESKHNLVRLNLNPNEELHNKLEDLLSKHLNLFNEIPQKATTKDLHLLNRKIEASYETLILIIRYIVKIEWEKTKRPNLSRFIYMKFGKGRKLLFEAIKLKTPKEKVTKTI